MIKIERQKRYVSWEEIISCVRELAQMLPLARFIWGPPRNGIIIAGLIAHQRDDLEIADVPSVSDKDYIIVDDIHDSGDTLMVYKKAGFFTASLFWRKKEEDNKPDFFAETVDNNDYLVFPWEKEENV